MFEVGQVKGVSVVLPYLQKNAFSAGNAFIGL